MNGIQVIAVDGKSANGSYDRESGTKALHLVSAGKRASVLAQAKVQDKSNEITAIPALLLDLAGCIVTLDAMGTQKYCSSDHTAGADYILSLKSNHPTLFQQVEQWFQQMDGSLPTPREHTTESGHHRIDTHRLDTLDLVCCPLSSRRVRQDCKVLSARNGPPMQPTSATPQSRPFRPHWGIENGLH